MAAFGWMLKPGLRVLDSRNRLGAAFLVGTISTVSAILGLTRDLRGQTPAPSEKPVANPADARKKAGPKLEPFDLLYLPVDSIGILASRPSVILAREDRRRPVEASLNWVFPEFTETFGADAWNKLPVKPEEIEQVAFGWLRSSAPAGKGQSDDQAPTCAVIRATHDLDWKKRIDEFFKWLDRESSERLEWVSVSFEGRNYYQLKMPGLLIPSLHIPVGFCYFPDHRTVVFTDEKHIRDLIRQPDRRQPDLARTEAWREMSRGLIAVAYEQEDPKAELDELGGLAFLLLDELSDDFRTTGRYSCGVDDDDIWRFRASLSYPDGDRANRAVFNLWVQLIWARVELLAVDIGWDQTLRGDLPPILYRCMSELFRSGRIRREGGTIDIVSRFRMPFTELQELFESGELDTPDGPKKPAHR